MRYIVKDSLGYVVGCFNSYPAASEFKGPRYDWIITPVK